MRAFFQLLPVTRVELDNVGRELRVTRKRNGRNEYQREADADNRFHLNLMPMKDEPRRRRISEWRRWRLLSMGRDW